MLTSRRYTRQKKAGEKKISQMQRKVEKELVRQFFEFIWANFCFWNCSNAFDSQFSLFNGAKCNTMQKPAKKSKEIFKSIYYTEKPSSHANGIKVFEVEKSTQSDWMKGREQVTVQCDVRKYRHLQITKRPSRTEDCWMFSIWASTPKKERPNEKLTA